MKRLADLIGAIPWPTLVIIAVLIGGAPFVPEANRSLHHAAPARTVVPAIASALVCYLLKRHL